MSDREDDPTIKVSEFMADDQNTAAQAVQDAPPVEGSESQVENQVGTTEVQNEGQDQPNAASEDQSEGDKPKEADNQSGQDAKPSRVERRIQSLLSKVKEAGQPKAELPRVEERKPLLDPNQIDDDGKVDPRVLEERINQRVQTEIRQALQMDRMTQQYETSVKEHNSDLEEVEKSNIDPELEAEAAKQYEAINYQVNPITGEKEFVPAVKFSEIVNTIQTRAERLAQKMAEKIAVGNAQHLKNVESSQAVPSSGAVSGSKSVKPETTDFSEFERAYNPANK